MITIYGLSFWSLNYLKKSLNSIIKNASEPIKIIVGDNKSKNSKEIKNYLIEMGESDKIHNAIFFEENIRTKAFLQMYNIVNPSIEDDFFVFTELDLVVPDGLDWIKEIRKMRNQSAIDCGFSLSLENYIFPNGGHNPDPNGNEMGIWLLGLDRKIFHENFPKNGKLTDGQIHNFFRTRGKIIRSRKELYHLGWDIWKDEPEYWKFKEAGANGGTDWFNNINESKYSIYQKC